MNELFYASAKGLMAAITETKNETIYSAQIKWFQVDNQLPGAHNPICIYPTVLKQDYKEKDIDNPVFFGSYSLSKEKDLGVEYYQWLTILLQELSVSFDDEFFRALIRFTTFSTQQSDETDPCDLTRNIQFPAVTDGHDRLYFEKLLLQPVQVNLSFTRSERKDDSKEDRFYCIDYCC